VIIVQIAFQDPSQMSFSHDHMVQAVMSNGSDQSLHIGSLPGAGRRAEDFLQAQASDALAKVLAVDLVPVPQQVTWHRIFGKGFHQLSSGPLRRGMLRHVEVNDAPAMMS
jgi:hypothetical protein